MADDRKPVDLGVDLQLEGAPSALFVERMVERGAPQVRMEEWTTSEPSLATLGEPTLRVAVPGREQALFDRGDVLIHVGVFSGGHAWATAAAPDEERVTAALAWVRERLPVTDPTSAHDVAVTFWTYGPHGPQPSWRSIAVPAWEDIRDNYAAATRARLEALMQGFEPARGGQLLLWHGRAGTGKTFALRALAWEWRAWCDFHYIVDPDTFFGQHADYLMSVLLQPAEATAFGFAGGLPHLPDDVELAALEHDTAPANRWKLLMLEDTGELLTADARALIGQGLSRFLNVVDGLIGQGLRVLVLVTTNEEVRRLHPAVARPGRCAANVEFSLLSAEEVSAWLDRHGVDGVPARTTTLASLYARAEGLDVEETPVAPGFGG